LVRFKIMNNLINVPMSHFTPQLHKNKASQENELMQPKAETIHKLLMFAACYHVEKIDNNKFFEIILN
jgi:hypothetical protein